MCVCDSSFFSYNFALDHFNQAKEAHNNARVLPVPVGDYSLIKQIFTMHFIFYLKPLSHFSCSRSAQNKVIEESIQ